MTAAAAHRFCLECRSAPPLEDGPHREVLCSSCAERREAAGVAPRRPPTTDNVEALGSVTQRVLKRAPAFSESAEVDVDEYERRGFAKALDFARRGLLVRVPHAWTDDLAAYEAAVESKKLRAVAERWSPDHGSLLVLGLTGTGKSVSVARAVRRLARAAESAAAPILHVRWTSGMTLALARRRHALGAGEAEEVAAALEAPVLVLDELGPEPLDATIHEVLDVRYSKGRITVTTSGMRLAELVAKYGDATVRRLTAPRGATIEVWR